MKKLLLFVLSVTFMLNAYPGDKGNIISSDNDELSHMWKGFYGANVVICRNNSQALTSASLLDFVEVQPFHKAPKIIYDGKYSDTHYIERLASKLEKLLPDTFGSFRREALKLERAIQSYQAHGTTGTADVKFVHQDLIQINDRNSDIRIQKGCQIEQLALRQKSFYGVDYVIHADYFSNLSAADRRGFILHEAFYHSFNMYYGDEDSARTRYFNRRIAQYSLKQLTDDVLMHIMKEAFVLY